MGVGGRYKTNGWEKHSSFMVQLIHILVNKREIEKNRLQKHIIIVDIYQYIHKYQNVTA